LRHADLVLLVRQLAALTRRGRPLDQALDQLAAGATLEDFPALREAAQAMRAGEPAEAALERVRGAPRLFAAAAGAAAGTGRLADTLDHLGQVFAAAHVAERRVRAAAVYPAFLGTAFVATLVALSFMTPEIERMYDSFGGSLPALTEFVLVVFSPPVAVVFALLYAAAAGMLLWGARRDAAWVDRLVLSVPGLGRLAREARLAAFSGALACGAEAGMTPERAGVLAAPLLGGAQLRYRASNAARGAQSYAPLIGAVAFDRFDALRLARRERSAQGPAAALRGLSADLRVRSIHLSQRIEGILEPVAVLLFGGLIGTLIIGAYLPIFSISGSVK
jgi:type IV pilus assembly protein PilC